MERTMINDLEVQLSNDEMMDIHGGVVAWVSFLVTYLLLGPFFEKRSRGNDNEDQSVEEEPGDESGSDVKSCIVLPPVLI